MIPKVSVCVVTYNHQAYIRQCLDSILSQVTNFDFEIVIGEDKSTDNTAAIVLQYQQKYPKIISVITSAKNVGAWSNYKRTLDACAGQYIAIIDGDDCFTSNYKLQKQVDLLDLHPDYTMCIHDVEILEEENVKKGRTLPTFNEGAVFAIEDIILKGWFIGPPCMMVRKTSKPILPDWAQNTICHDLANQLICATQGKIGYIKETLALYRIQAGGISQVSWAGKQNVMPMAHIDLFIAFNKDTAGKYWPFIKMRLGRFYKELMRVNPVFSKIYISSLMHIAALGSAVYVPMLKHWLVTSVVPQRLYKAYKSTKQGTLSGASHS